MSVRLPLLFCVLCVLCIFPTLINANGAETYETRKEKLLEYYQNDPCKLEHAEWESCREAMNLFKGLPKKKRRFCAFVEDYTCSVYNVCLFRSAASSKIRAEKRMTWCLDQAGIKPAEEKGGKKRWSVKRGLNAVRKMITGAKKGHKKNAPQHEDHKDGDPRHEDSTDETPKNRGP